jgi:hypothetical protein
MIASHMNRRTFLAGPFHGMGIGPDVERRGLRDNIGVDSGLPDPLRLYSS